MGVLSSLRLHLGTKKPHSEHDELKSEVEYITLVMNQLRAIRNDLKKTNSFEDLKRISIEVNGKIYIVQRLLTQMRECTNEMKHISKLSSLVKLREKKTEELEVELRQFLIMQKELVEKMRPIEKKRIKQAKRVTFSFDLSVHVYDVDKMSVLEEKYQSIRRSASMCSP
jgi:hypothetical protein